MRHLKTLAVTAFVIVGLPVLLTEAAAGQGPSHPGSPPASAFRPVEVRDAVAMPAPVVTLTPPPPVIYETTIAPPDPTARPQIAQNVLAVTEIVKPTPRPTIAPKPAVTHTVVVSSTGHFVRGTATWYCRSGISVCHYKYPDRSGVVDMYAAAGPALRVGNWRGRTVRVCDSNSCIHVRLIDWCGCMSGKTGRVIDLYWDAFHALDPRATGGISVRVSW